MAIYYPLLTDVENNPVMIETAYGEGYALLCQVLLPEEFNAMSNVMTPGAGLFINTVEYLFDIRANGLPEHMDPGKYDIVNLDPLTIKRSSYDFLEFVFLVKRKADIAICFYELNGQLICSVEGNFDKGVHKMKWDMKDGSGRYTVAGLKIVLMKVNGKAAAIQKINIYR